VEAPVWWPAGTLRMQAAVLRLPLHSHTCTGCLAQPTTTAPPSRLQAVAGTMRARPAWLAGLLLLLAAAGELAAGPECDWSSRTGRALGLLLLLDKPLHAVIPPTAGTLG